MRCVTLVVCAVLCVRGTFAADEPVYEPPPDWVLPAEFPQDAPSSGEVPLEALLVDEQVRLDARGTHDYLRMVLRVNTPQGLSALNTLSAEWAPQFQTLTLHNVTIRREGGVLDALARGQRFSVLRRESNLEYAMLDGTLSAVLQPEDLRVGDVVDFAFTISGSDPAMQGMAQAVLLPPQLRVEKVRLRASWPRQMNVHWRATGTMKEAVRETKSRAESAVEVELESSEAYLPPTGAPARYLLPPLIELSSYPSWRQVSAQMAPLFERAAELAPDSAVRTEIERIRAAYATPIERAGAALRMVQDDVRYLYVALDVGGLVPASAEETWQRRFGDCKGKTALLLAVLHGLGISAEPVLIDSISGDALRDRLPMIGAFDHVLVRAEIDGKTYWLDGTSSGDGSLDRISTPFFHWGLPVRRGDAELVEIKPQPLTEPDTRISMRLDFSAGITAPGKVEGEAVFSGGPANLMRETLAVVSADEADKALRAVWALYYPAVRIDSVTGSSNLPTGEYAVKMSGTVRSLWPGNRYRSVVGDLVAASGKLARPEDEDQQAPYAIRFPFYTQVEETLILPQEGRGFSVDGSTIEVTTFGQEIRRSAHIDGSTAVIEGSTRGIANEIPASEIREAERMLASISGRQLYVVAPSIYRPSAEEQESALGPEPTTAAEFVDRGLVHLNNARYDLAVQDFTSALELAPNDAYARADRGIAHAWRKDADKAQQDLAAAQALDPNNPVVFRGYGLLAMQRGNYAEAIEQLTRAIEADLSNSFAYDLRGKARLATGDLEGAMEDSRAATRLSPRLASPYFVRASVDTMQGQGGRAIDELDTMLSSANVDPLTFRFSAQMLAQLGERKRAADTITRAIEAQPTAADLIFRAALLEGTDLDGKRVDLEAALAMEPRSRPARMGLASIHLEAKRPDQAIPLLDELIELDPTDAPALAERGIAHVQSGSEALARADFDAARSATSSARVLNELCWRKATLDVALEEAVEDCKRGIELEPNAPIYDSLGFAYLRLGHYQDAVEAYDAALALRANQPTSLFGRALAKRRLGDEEGYRQDMSGAERLLPEVAKQFASYGVVP